MLDITPQTLNKYLSGTKRPGLKPQSALRKVGIDSDFIMTGRTAKDPTLAFQYLYPVIGTIRAGTGNTETRYVYEAVMEYPGPAVDEFKGALYFKVEGRSMEPAFFEGDLVLAHPNVKPKSGEYAIVGFNNDTSCLKRVVFDGDRVLLLSLNPQYEPIILDKRSDDIWFLGSILVIVPRQNVAYIERLRGM